MYFEKDLARGIDGTFMWLMEEVGELAGALQNGTHEERLWEFADVLAWLATMRTSPASILGESRKAQKYGARLPRCGQFPVCTLRQCRKALNSRSKPAMSKPPSPFVTILAICCSLYFATVADSVLINLLPRPTPSSR